MSCQYYYFEALVFYFLSLSSICFHLCFSISLFYQFIYFMLFFFSLFCQVFRKCAEFLCVVVSCFCELPVRKKLSLLYLLNHSYSDVFLKYTFLTWHLWCLHVCFCFLETFSLVFALSSHISDNVFLSDVVSSVIHLCYIVWFLIIFNVYFRG